MRAPFFRVHTSGVDVTTRSTQARCAIEDKPAAWHRSDEKIAVRFPDPEGRLDEAGRVIPHEFVLFGNWAQENSSLEDIVQLVWPLVAEEFKEVWDKPTDERLLDHTGRHLEVR